MAGTGREQLRKKNLGEGDESEKSETHAGGEKKCQPILSFSTLFSSIATVAAPRSRAKCVLHVDARGEMESAPWGRRRGRRRRRRRRKSFFLLPISSFLQSIFFSSARDRTPPTPFRFFPVFFFTDSSPLSAPLLPASFFSSQPQQQQPTFKLTMVSRTTVLALGVLALAGTATASRDLLGKNNGGAGEAGEAAAVAPVKAKAAKPQKAPKVKSVSSEAGEAAPIKVWTFFLR